MPLEHPYKMMTTSISLQLGANTQDLCFGVITAAQCRIEASSPELCRALEDTIKASRTRTDLDARRKLARDMLRHGKYKPTGRGKPASEYLLEAALRDEFPTINNVVDINNLLSLQLLLPCSVIDLDLAQSLDFLARRGHVGESYVFNAGGQSIELQDLLLVASLPQDSPCANAVKDSLATKTTENSQNIALFVYGHCSLQTEIEQALAQATQLLVEFASAQHCVSTLVR